MLLAHGVLVQHRLGGMDRGEPAAQLVIGDGALRINHRVKIIRRGAVVGVAESLDFRTDFEIAIDGSEIW